MAGPESVRTCQTHGVEIYDALEAEEQQLAAVLAGLTTAQWDAPAACAGWSMADVLLHLAQCEEAVVATLQGDALDWSALGDSVESAMDSYVAAERSGGPAVLARWEGARRAALAAFRAADQRARFAWVTNTLRPASLATTRLAEHWAHALDIAGPLGIDYPDTDRLRHILWLAHATLPYAFGVAGEDAPSVRIEAVAPAGEVWVFGAEDAEAVVRGSAGELARIGARRLDPGGSSVTTSGQRGGEVLARLRNFAV